jgi:hypothetical protein
MDKDFERHRVVGGQLRRRQLQPIDSLVDPSAGPASPSNPASSQKKRLHAGPSTTFDAQSYITQLSSTYLPTGASGSPEGIPIHSMSEFRAKVISSKRLQSPPGVLRQSNLHPSGSAPAAGTSPGSDTRFMLQHNPAGK